LVAANWVFSGLELGGCLALRPGTSKATPAGNAKLRSGVLGGHACAGPDSWARLKCGGRGRNGRHRV